MPRLAFRLDGEHTMLVRGIEHIASLSVVRQPLCLDDLPVRVLTHHPLFTLPVSERKRHAVGLVRQLLVVATQRCPLLEPPQRHPD